MLEEGRSCIDIAQQLQAVESAIANAKRTLIHDHIDHCLDGSIGKRAVGSKVLKEFKDISKYL
jgi:DNA-binding FrmR family transcriptional regulator